MIKKIARKILNQSAPGFSLMEMVVVLAVFSMTALMAVDLFVTVTNVQRQVRNLQVVQSDARFVMESIAREAQVGTIDYDFYRGHCEGGTDEEGINYTSCISDADCNGVFGECINIDISAGPVNILATKDQENKQVIYRYDSASEEIEVCSNSSFYRNRCSAEINWQVVTPEKVRISLLSLYIFPHSDPFSIPTGCSVDSDCYPEICTDNLCAIPDVQPMVTIVMNSKVGEGIEGEEVNLQTTVTSMIFRR
ncbi:MAG: type II secretion system protein [Patescibacteria group bacterium]|jgi:prepilin-type N-terminal cleavage/methylation domain-containing protein